MGQVEPTFRSCDKCLGEGIVPMKDDYGWWVCGCGANLVPDGRLQAIADAWSAYREDGGTRDSEAMDNFVGVIMDVVEDNDE